MINPIRTLLMLGVEVVEALLHLVDFNESADELWYADRLADNEDEEEVTEPESAYHVAFAASDNISFKSSSAASPVPAADDLPSSCSVPNQDVEREEGLQPLSVNDLYKAANFAYLHDNEDGLWRRLDAYARYLESQLWHDRQERHRCGRNVSPGR